MKLTLLLLSAFLSMPRLADAADAVGATSTASPNLVRIVVSLVLVVGILIVLAITFKKFGLNRMQSAFPVKIIGAVSLGSNQRIMIIEAGEEWIVLGVTPQNISTITRMPRQEGDNTAGGIDKPDVPAWMQSALGKYLVKKA